MISYRSETWRLRQDDLEIFRTKRVMCGAKSIKKRSSEELADLLGLEKSLHRQVKAYGV